MNPVSYADLLRNHGFYPLDRGPWAMVGRSSGQYGWKLHLSCVQQEVIPLLDVVLPVLRQRACAFKVAMNAQVLGMLNEGALGATQVGKFMTIYPSSPAAAVELAQELVPLTKEKFVKGPQIVTDMHLGGAVYTRYGTFSPDMMRNRLGMFVGLDGEEIGKYATPFVTPENIRNPFSETQPEILGELQSTLQSHGYLILQALQVHAKGSVYLALDLRDRETVDVVVLKEGRQGCMSDDHGRDIRDRLHHQVAVHADLDGLVPVPRAGPLFEFGHNAYLPLEYIPGRDLGERAATPYRRLPPPEQRTLLSSLALSGQSLQELHQHHYVHRDLSMRNVRVSEDGRVVLLDLELAHRAGETAGPAPFFQGTPGFVSPQQLAERTPSFSDDVFAFGAILVCALTGCDPQRVGYANPEDRAGQIYDLSGASLAVCRIAASCLAEDAGRRPDLKSVIALLEEESLIPC